MFRAPARSIYRRLLLTGALAACGCGQELGAGDISGTSGTLGAGGTGTTSGGNSAGGNGSGGGPLTSGGGAAAGGSDTTDGGTSGGGTSGGGTSGGGSGAQSAGGTGGRGGPGSGGASGGSGGGGSTGPFGGAITLDGRKLLVGGVPLQLKGVCWNPVPQGARHPEGLDFDGLGAIDIPLMQAAGINVIRTYEPLLDTMVLDQLAAAKIYVINSVYPSGDDASVVVSRVNAVKSHPAILMWAIGNEWNYNGFYVDLTEPVSQGKVQEAAQLIKQNDTAHPVATIYGGSPAKATVDALSAVDVWGLNVYSGITFGNLFSDWPGRSSKPMFVSEYGADAWDSNEGANGAYNPEAQATATTALTQELLDNSSIQPSGVALGGTIFEWADEWWKVDGGSLSAQDQGGIAPGSGPYPDATFNEEYWGIVDIERNPRAAYDALKALYLAPSATE